MGPIGGGGRSLSEDYEETLFEPVESFDTGRFHDYFYQLLTNPSEEKKSWGQNITNDMVKN